MALDMKIDQLRSDLNDLKQSLKSPSIYIANYFSNLINEIDIECESFIQKQEIKKTEQTSRRLALKATENQDLIIKEVKAFEKLCIAELNLNGLDTKLLHDVTKSIQIIESQIDQNESKLQELDGIAYDLLVRIQRVLFLNKGILFVSRENRINKDASLINKSFGALVIVEDDFIGKRGFLKR